MSEQPLDVVKQPLENQPTTKQFYATMNFGAYKVSQRRADMPEMTLEDLHVYSSGVSPQIVTGT